MYCNLKQSPVVILRYWFSDSVRLFKKILWCDRCSVIFFVALILHVNVVSAMQINVVIFLKFNDEFWWWCVVFFFLLEQKKLFQFTHWAIPFYIQTFLYFYQLKLLFIKCEMKEIEKISSFWEVVAQKRPTQVLTLSWKYDIHIVYRHNHKKSMKT